ncbi:MAG TPA: metallophosphoesterase family protein [Treponemataceae bacterium]|nr:metallophosphoesterase family protein [Treponemataceae bacterium]
MRFLVLSDIHGDLKYLELLNEEFADADAVLFAGDFAAMGKPETALPVLNTLIKKHESLYAVLGNCDEPSFREELEILDVSVQGDVVFRDGLAFAGSGGALRFTGVTPFERTEDEILHDLRIISEQQTTQMVNASDWGDLILLVHQPPANTKLDLVSAGLHVGSKKLRAFIEEHKPLVLICGHIHESAAVDTINDTICINPGALVEGRYAILEIEKKDDKWHVTKAELKQL